MTDPLTEAELRIVEFWRGGVGNALVTIIDRLAAAPRAERESFRRFHKWGCPAQYGPAYACVSHCGLDEVLDAAVPVSPSVDPEEG